jgi:hypothetical protein
LHGADTRVRDGDVQPAELRDALVDDLPEGGGVPDVGLPGDDLPAERRRGLDGVREVLLGAHAVADRFVVLEDIDGDDVRAPLRQPDRVTAALAAGRAGDERDLACYSSCHGVGCPFRWFRRGSQTRYETPRREQSRLRPAIEIAYFPVIKLLPGNRVNRSGTSGQNPARYGLLG